MNDHSKSSHIIRLLVGLFIALAFAVSVLILALPRLGVSLEELWAEDGAPESPDISAEASSVAEGAWRYMDAGAEPGVGALWTTGYYDAEDWKRGDAPFAERASGGGCQLLPDQSADGGGSPSFYFRREFQLDSLDNVFAISGTVRYSDAVLVYLNGEVIFAGNVPAGGFAAGTDLGCAADPGTVHEDSFLVTDLSALRVGENILAVELHQAAADGGSACFQMPYFNLLAEETQAPVPAPENIFLEMGDMGRQIWVDWLTEDAGYYELQYMTADEYEALEDKENGFSLYADRAFMGRTSDGERDCYLDRGPITDLKAGEEYLYRVAAVGSDTASELMRFTAPENNRYTFTVLGGALGPDETAAEMDAAAERAGRLDLLIAPRRLIDGGQEPARRIPSRLIPREGADSFAYLDALIVILGEQVTDPDLQAAYIREAAEGADQAWLIAVAPAPADGRQLPEDLGADLVIHPEQQDVLLVEMTGDGPRVLDAGEESPGA